MTLVQVEFYDTKQRGAVNKARSQMREKGMELRTKVMFTPGEVGRINTHTDLYMETRELRGAFNRQSLFSQ